MTRQLVLPAAAPGILTGTVLALSRALGETAPLLLAARCSAGFSTGSGLIEQLRPVHGAAGDRLRLGAQAAGGVPRADRGRDHRPARRSRCLANAIAIYLRNRYERTW